MRRHARRWVTALAVVAVGCASDTSKSGIEVAYAQVDLIDSAGVVTASVPVVTDGAVGTPIRVTRAVPTHIRVVWFGADSMPDPGASDASLEVRLSVPAGFGLTFTRSATARYEGILVGATLQPAPVFVPLHLFDLRKGISVFSALAPIIVQ